MDTPFITKDTGVREEQGTGAVRDSREGKGRYDLLPAHAIRRIAGVYERGAAKYASRNWESGMAYSRYIDSALRHIFQHLEGRRDEDHIGHAAFNLLAILEHDERVKLGTLSPHLDDLPIHKAHGGFVTQTPEMLEVKHSGCCGRHHWSHGVYPTEQPQYLGEKAFLSTVPATD